MYKSKSETPPARIAIVANIAWHLFNFRRGLARRFKDAGYDVVLMAAPDGYESRLEEEGWTFVPLQQLDRTGMNPLKEPLLLRELMREYRRHDINLVVQYTSKPNIWGNVAAGRLRIPAISTINGLGGPFSGERRIVAWIASRLYRYALRYCGAVMFQNAHDQEFFISNRLVAASKTQIVKGSGVNLREFNPSLHPARAADGKVVFLMFSRLSTAKGVIEYVEAASALVEKYTCAEFRLAGPFDNDELAVSPEEVAAWQAQGAIRYLGVSDFMQREISQADCIVYPSYYMEGIPRALLEAAAMAKPIITTDHVGCKETVVDGVNGLTVPIRDNESLQAAMEKMIQMTAEERLSMGQKSRLLAERDFDEDLVNACYVDAARKLLNVRKL